MKFHMPILTTVETAARDATVAAAKKVYKRSSELVPRADGGLQRSGAVVVEDLEVRIVYSSPIAYLQHERTEWQHSEGRQAKFLEAAVDQTDIASLVAESVRARLNG